MNMNKVSKLFAGLVLAVGAVSSSSALVLTSGGYKITIDTYASGTTGYGFTAGNVCSTAAACDAAGASPALNSFGDDTWGIFSISTITKISDFTDVWTRGVDGYRFGMFGGLTDFNVDVSGSGLGTTTAALSHGGFLNIYQTNTNTFGTAVNGGTAGRTGLNTFNGITTAGTLVLSANFSAGVSLLDSSATYSNDYLNTSLSGHGHGFLDITGGTEAGQYAQSEMDLNGNFHHLVFTATSLATTRANWTVSGTADAQNTDLPEPASLALFGLGLAGLASLRRRQSK